MKKTDLNILIIEDDKTQRAALVEGVQRKGYKAVGVGKPDEAESIVRIKPIHFVIADCMLPGKNGVDLVIKLKENLGENTGIAFVSGIFKDKKFASETIKKTGAIEFFFKPYNIEDILKVIDKKLQEYLQAPKIDLHSLLAAPFASGRERRKALDHVEELSGYDLPFVFSILMESESSGHLNIVDKKQNIYGVTFAKGAIAKVDSESTGIHTKKLLITHGFITELELNEVSQKIKASDLVKTLVDEGYISPHVPGIIKINTVVSELNKLVSDQSVNINFVPDRKTKEERDNVDIAAFTPQLHDMIDRLMPAAWLKKFYEIWLGHSIQLGPQISDFHLYSEYAIFKRVPGIQDIIKNKPTIEDLLTRKDYKEDDIFKALHFLAVRRLVVFEELKQIKNIDEHVGRIKTTHAALQGKDPFRIFTYFGLGENPKATDVARVYKEFSKSYHPDILPQSVASEIRAVNMELFAQVTGAYDILTNDNKRQEYINTLKQAEAEKQIKSDEMVTFAAVSLERGRYSEALPILENAVQIYSSDRCLLHLYWARFKVEGKVSPDELPGIEKTLKAMPQATRGNFLHIFVMGLVKKAYGDKRAAFESFQRVLTMQDDFMDARREIANLKSQLASGNPNQKVDLLHADLGQVLGNLFSKKKKGA